jgi:hypothetical protein
MVEQVHRGREDVMRSHIKTSVTRLLTKRSLYVHIEKHKRSKGHANEKRTILRYM